MPSMLPKRKGDEINSTASFHGMTTRSKRAKRDYSRTPGASTPAEGANTPVSRQEGGEQEQGDLESQVRQRDRALSIKSSKPVQKHRSYTTLFPKTCTKDLHQSSLQRKQISKLHRANLRALRDFPRTLCTFALPTISDSDDEDYILEPRADSIPTSGQSTPKSSPEPIPSGEDLFGYLAKSPIPSSSSSSSTLLSSFSSDIS